MLESPGRRLAANKQSSSSPSPPSPSSRRAAKKRDVSPLRHERRRPSPPTSFDYRRPTSAGGALVSRRNSKLVSFLIVIMVTFAGCLFFPLFVTVSFIVLLNRRVADAIPRGWAASEPVRVGAQLVACLPFFFAGPVLLTIGAAVQILFSAYHSAASEFLLISFCLPFVFTSPWWGSWWYLCYIPAAIGVPLTQLAWRVGKSRLSPVWQKWSFEKGNRARIVTAVNSAWRGTEALLQGAGTSFPFLKYIRGFLRKTFA